jgi:hypothetical protein
MLQYNQLYILSNETMIHKSTNLDDSFQWETKILQWSSNFIFIKYHDIMINRILMKCRKFTSFFYKYCFDRYSLMKQSCFILFIDLSIS